MCVQKSTRRLDNKNPRARILAATMFAIRATYHTTMQASPMQLVFGRDAILNIKHVANWDHIKELKQAKIDANNKRENQSRIEHHYQVGDQVLIRARKNTKHDKEYEGPYPLTKVNTNGTVNFQKGIVNDVINIRRVKPFFR